MTRAVSWIAAIWTVGLAVAYAITARATVLHPFNGGLDRPWALAIVGGAAGAAVAFAVLGRRLLPAAVAAAAVFAAIEIVRSGGLRSAAAAGAVLAVAYVSGGTILVRRRDEDAGETRPFATVLLTGLSTLAMVGCALAAAGALSPRAIAVCLVSLAALQARTLPGVVRRVWRAVGRGLAPRERASAVEEGLLTTLLLVLALLGLAWALAPEVQFDALNYQLAAPRDWIAARRFVAAPDTWLAWFARLVNMVYALGLALGGTAAAKLLAWALTWLGVLAAYDAGRLLFSPRAGLRAAALSASTPLVFWLSSTTYVDGAIAALLTAAFAAFVRWRRSSDDRWLAAFAILAGSAVGAKITSLYALPVLAFAVAWELRRRPLRSLARSSSLLALLLALFALPWYAVAWRYTGNPVFPMFNGVFRSPLWPPVNGLFNAGMYGVSGKLGEWIVLPAVVTFQSQRFGEALLPGTLGAWALLLPIAVLSIFTRRDRPQALLLLALVASFLAAWAFTGQYARFMIPILPLAAVLVCGALDAPASGGADAAVSCGLSLLVVAQCALVPVLFWNIPDRIPLRLALGRATREELLDAALPGWRCAEALGRLAKPGEKVLGWDVDKLRYYVAPSLATPLGDPRLFEALEGKKDAELADALERRSYRFLLLNLGSSRALIAARFGEKFLERQAVPVGMCEGIASFRVVRGGSASSPSRADPAAAGLD